MKVMPIAPGGAPSGSYAGLTASHNRYGYYLRARVVPTNPSSSRQQDVRSVFRALTRFWTLFLTQANRDAWNLYGQNITKTDVLGNQFHLPGFNWYVGNNSVVVQCGSTQVAAGPVTMTLPASDPSVDFTLSGGGSTVSVAFDDTREWCDEDAGHLHVKMSQPRDEGRSYIQGPFKFAGTIDGDPVTPPTTPQTVPLPFAVAEDQLVTFECRIVKPDGRVSSAFKKTVTVGS